MYVPLTPCFVIWRALTRENKQNNKSFTTQKDSIPKKYCSEFYKDDTGFMSKSLCDR
jgi:hypothetical protein